MDEEMVYPDIPDECPGCGADLTAHGAVAEVQEMYNQCHVEDGEFIDEQKEVCGECVRALCNECGGYLYGPRDTMKYEAADPAIRRRLQAEDNDE